MPTEHGFETREERDERNAALTPLYQQAVERVATAFDTLLNEFFTERSGPETRRYFAARKIELKNDPFTSSWDIQTAVQGRQIVILSIVNINEIHSGYRSEPHFEIVIEGFRHLMHHGDREAFRSALESMTAIGVADRDEGR